MSRFNTGNPIDSDRLEDLSDNAKNIDLAANSSADTFQDRLGRNRLTWSGIVKAGTGDPAIAVDAADRAVDAADRAESAESSVEQNAEQIAQDAAEQAAQNVVAGVDGQVAVAQSAADRAETARDAAFVNADVYPDIASGLAAVADGEQFQVVEGDEIVRYRRINASNEEEVARYPSIQLSRDLARVDHHQALAQRSPNRILTPSPGYRGLLGWSTGYPDARLELLGEASDSVKIVRDGTTSSRGAFYLVDVPEGVETFSVSIRIESKTVNLGSLEIQQSLKRGAYLTVPTEDRADDNIVLAIPPSSELPATLTGTFSIASGTKSIVFRVVTGSGSGDVTFSDPMISFGDDSRYRASTFPAKVKGSEARYGLIDASAPLSDVADAWPLSQGASFYSAWRPWLKPSPAAACFDISRSRLWQDHEMTIPASIDDPVRVIEDAISGEAHRVIGDPVTFVEKNGNVGLRFLGTSRIDTGLPGFESTASSVNMVVAYEPENTDTAVVITSDGEVNRFNTSAKILANVSGDVSVVCGGKFAEYSQDTITVIQSAFTKGETGRVYVGSAPAITTSAGSVGYDSDSGTISVGASPADSFRGDGVVSGFTGVVYYYYASHDNPSDADARFHNRYAMYRAGALEAPDAPTISTGSFLYSSSIDAIDDLYAAYSYPSGKRELPIVVVMHGYTGAAADMVPFVINDMAEYGFFSLAVGMRGRDGASGSPDVGGREIYDIIDAVEYAKTNFTGIVDPNNVHIAGYSGGGGNVMSAAAKFPDYFIVKASHFGISDYGYDPDFSWGELSTGRRSSLADWIGFRPRSTWSGDAPVNLGAYRSRNTLESVPTVALGGHLYLYHDMQDNNTQPSLSTRMKDAMDAAGNDRYSISLTDTGDTIRWLHQRPLENEPVRHTRSEWGAAILAREFLPWRMPSFGTVRVIGYMRTKEFEIWLGNGQEAVADLTYDVYAGTFKVTLLTSADQLVTVTREDQTGSATANPGVPTTITIS